MSRSARRTISEEHPMAEFPPTGEAAYDATDPALLSLIWAKTAPHGYHPILGHLLDVAAVAEVLWDRSLPPATRAEVAAALGLSVGQARSWVTFFASMHDLGKIAACFQRKSDEAKTRLAAAGLP